MMVLAPGANTAISSARSEWTLASGKPSAFGEYAAVAVLPVDGQIDDSMDLRTHGESTIIMGEFYSRNQRQGSAYGLAELERRIGFSINGVHPDGRSNSSDSDRTRADATGTGFTVSKNHILACAHVIEGMQALLMSSFEEPCQVGPVGGDRRKNIALPRVLDAAQRQSETFKAGFGGELGESVTAPVCPLAGFAGGGAQVTQGGISGLFSLYNNSSLLQFTAPIQSGSSGSPLFNYTGAVVGWETPTLPDAQNMNVAVESSPLLSSLDACRVEASQTSVVKTFTTAPLAREAQSSMWRVEARNF